LEDNRSEQVEITTIPQKKGACKQQVPATRGEVQQTRRGKANRGTTETGPKKPGRSLAGGKKRGEKKKKKPWKHGEKTEKKKRGKKGENKEQKKGIQK